MLALIPRKALLIAGETANYGFRFCTDLGINVIETSHELSDRPGLRRYAQAISVRFPDLDASPTRIRARGPRGDASSPGPPSAPVKARGPAQPALV